VLVFLVVVYSIATYPVLINCCDRI
jgi:hypothetical protein